jgi:hypothetical protein
MTSRLGRFLKRRRLSACGHAQAGYCVLPAHSILARDHLECDGRAERRHRFGGRGAPGKSAGPPHPIPSSENDENEYDLPRGAGDDLKPSTTAPLGSEFRLQPAERWKFLGVPVCRASDRLKPGLQTRGHTTRQGSFPTVIYLCYHPSWFSLLCQSTLKAASMPWQCKKP